MAFYPFFPTGGGGGAVDTVFGRAGNVTAQTGDYTAAQVTGAASQTFVTSAVGGSPKQWANAVTEFGADPTGATDSTAAIQAALLSFGTLGGAGSAGGVVYLPAGDFATSKPLIVPAGVTLQGSGFGTIIDLTTGSNCDVIQWATYQSAAQAVILGVSAASIANAFWAAVVNLQIHGDAFHTTIAGYHHGINITLNPLNATAPGDPDFDPHPLVRDVWIKGVTGDGLNHQGRSGGLFERVWSAYNNGIGFVPSYDTTMIDCLPQECQSGFYFGHGSDTGAGCKSYNNKDQTWVSGTAYTAGNVTVASGLMYFCILAVTSATPPGSDPAHWTQLTAATAPQATGYGHYWDTNAGEHTWSGDSQQNSKGDYYFKGPNQGAITLTGSSNGVNFNNGQPDWNNANPNNYAAVTFDGVTGVTAIINSSSQTQNGIICTELNSPSGNILIATTDGTEAALFHGGTPTVAQVNGKIYGGATVSGDVAINAGSYNSTPLVSSEDGTTTSHGALVHVLGSPTTESGHYLLLFDENDPAYLGLAMALNAGLTYNGQPIIALGGFWNGLGVQGSSNGTNNPVFGVLNSAQSGKGTGQTALTVYDTNLIETFHNILDDGNGNTTAIGYVQPGNGTAGGGHLYSGSGAPNITASVAGDLYLRTDTPSTASQRLYIATAANTWTGIL